MPSDQWPKDFIIMCSRGLDHKGRPGQNSLGDVLGIWPEDVWEKSYAEGAESSRDTCSTWIQRITVSSQAELTELTSSIRERREKVDTTGIEAQTVASLGTLERLVNRGQDGHVRTVKGKRTRREAPKGR